MLRQTALLLLLGGCWTDWRIQACVNETTATCEVRNVSVGQTQRSFLVSRLYGPSTCANRVPLVVGLHGSGGNGATARRDLADLELVANGGALFVYPDALEDRKLEWNLDPNGEDLAFFDALVAKMAEDPCVDSTRIFSVGHSRGGRFVEVLGCFRGERHRALAAISAGGGSVSDCPMRAPIWLAHGVDDQTVPYSDGAKLRDDWATRNECQPSGDNFPREQCTDYAGCALPLTFCPYSGTMWEGHYPPPFLGAELWEFFLHFF